MSRIHAHHDFDGFNRESWPAMTQWLTEHVRKFDKAFSKVLPEINKSIKGK